MNKGEYKFTKPQSEESFWPENETNLSELDPKNLTIDATIMSTEPEKPLSEVEKAQSDVDRYEAKLAEQERELEKTKFYLTICKRSLKAHLKAEEKFKK